MGKKDISAGILLSKKEYFCDLVNGGLYRGEQKLRPQMLRQMPTELYLRAEKKKKRQYAKRNPDLIFAAGDEEDYLLLLDENQNKVDYTMPLRQLVNGGLAYLQQANAIRQAHTERRDLKTGAEYLSGFTKEDKLHPVICFTFYHGEEPWDGSTRLYDMLRFPKGMEEMRCFCPDYRMNLIHAGNVSPAHFRTGLRTVFELLPFAKDKEKMMAYTKENAEHFQQLTEEECDLLSVLMGMEVLGRTQRSSFADERGGYDMCTALKQIMEEGIETGIKRGIQTGLERGTRAGAQEKARTIARNMFLRRMTAQEAAALCEEDLELVKSWYAGWQVECGRADAAE